MTFRVNLTLELDKPGGELITRSEVPVQCVYEKARWRVQCADPPVSTLLYDSMEEALISAAKEISQDWATPAE